MNHDGSELGIAEKYICEYCHRSYDSKTYLDDHVIEEHFTTERAFQCMHCLERLNTFDELNEHSINRCCSHMRSYAAATWATMEAVHNLMLEVMITMIRVKIIILYLY